MENNGSNFWEEKNSFLEALTLEDAKFIFSQAEKRFSDTLETAKRIYDRSYGLLTVISGLLISLSAYSIGRWETKLIFDNLEITAISGIFYFLCVGLLFLFKNVNPQDYNLPGTSPKNYFVKAFFNEKLENIDRNLMLIKVEIINYSHRIENNDGINELRWRFYVICLKSLFFSPIFFITVYIICLFFNK